MATEEPAVPDGLTTESLMKQPKRRLAETIQAQCRLAELRNFEWATAVWEREVLAAQVARVMSFLDRVEAEPCVPCLKYVPRDVRKMLTENPPERGDE